MEKLKQIMYGVTDFALMRAENGYFVDRTGLIRELEKTSFENVQSSFDNVWSQKLIANF